MRCYVVSSKDLSCFALNFSNCAKHTVPCPEISMAKFRGRPTVKAKFAVVKKLRCATVIATMQVSRIITGKHIIVSWKDW